MNFEETKGRLSKLMTATRIDYEIVESAEGDEKRAIQKRIRDSLREMETLMPDFIMGSKNSN